MNFAKHSNVQDEDGSPLSLRSHVDTFSERIRGVGAPHVRCAEEKFKITRRVDVIHYGYSCRAPECASRRRCTPQPEICVRVRSRYHYCERRPQRALPHSNRDGDIVFNEKPPCTRSRYMLHVLTRTLIARDISFSSLFVSIAAAAQLCASTLISP